MSRDVGDGLISYYPPEMSTETGQGNTKSHSDETNSKGAPKGELSGKKRKHNTNPPADRVFQKMFKRLVRGSWRKIKSFGHWVKHNAQPILAVATILILLIYVGQLTEMRKSTNAAKRAARLAKKSIEHVETNARLDQRAWVTIRTAKLIKLPALDEIPIVVLQLFNSGKTPALKLHTSSLVYVGNHADLTTRDRHPLGQQTEGLIGPN